SISAQTQYSLNMVVSPLGSGTTTPTGSSFYNANAVQPITASANTGWFFSSWTGTGSGSSSATTSSSSVTLNGPITEQANFYSTSTSSTSTTSSTSSTSTTSTSTTTIIPATLDGEVDSGYRGYGTCYPYGGGGQDFCINPAVTLSTTNPGDVIFVYFTQAGGALSQSPPISDSAGLSWHQRTSAGYPIVWYAVANAKLSSDLIQVYDAGLVCQNPNGGCQVYEEDLAAFAFNGLNTTRPIDPNSLLPITPTYSTTNSFIISTTKPNDVIIAYWESVSAPLGSCGTLIPPNGFTLLSNDPYPYTSDWAAIAYKTVSITQSNANYTWGGTASPCRGQIETDAGTSN
ncbi:MAG: hypothetical protein KGH59_04580, partial [Candidatus Micrarchaeota archaeon]|nr:hypothetical protein [Candidatus Micrarchaeota archaeon]